MEDILIPIVVFSSLLLFLKMLLDYSRFKHEHKAGTRTKGIDGGSNSLAVSELEGLIEGAVQHAVRPLERRLRRLERVQRSSADSSGENEAVDDMSDLDGQSDLVQDIDDTDEYEAPLSARGGNVYDVGASKPRVRRH